MNELLTIELLGGISLKQGEQRPIPLKSRKAEALFAYLVCQARPVARETLATIFWDKSAPDQAMANLRKLLTTLRKRLGDYLLIERQTVAFNRERAYWLDTAEFDRLLEIGEPVLSMSEDWRLTPGNLQSPISNLQKAVALYRGDFLAELRLPDSPDFEAWAALERERLRRLLIETLHQLTGHHLRRRQYEKGIAHAARLLALDPLSEAAHRQMMLLLARSGQVEAALAHYETCRRLLADELGVAPTGATTALFQRIGAAVTHSPNLPEITTSFIGREAELAQINRHLDDPSCRLLTLVGPGGVGKTRLALQAAAGRAFDFLHGVYFISLVGMDAAAALAPTIAEAIHFTLSGAQSPGQQLLDYLRPKEMLLVLDNGEQLLADPVPDAAVFVLDILQQAPLVRLLATSRERFNFQAEWVMNVRGLPLPDAGAQGRGDAGTQGAVWLFQERAGQAQAGFALSAETLPDVVRICQLVEGLPLGIELAAAAVAGYSPAAIGDEIERNLDFLTRNAVHLPDRHRNMRAVFESSWRLLTPGEQETFKRLSVFRGSFAAEAAVTITETTPFDLLSLVDKSMLRLVEPGRYRPHELLRQYAAEKLTAAAETAVRNRHCHYYAAFLQQRETALHGQKQQETQNEIRVEIENIRAAWQWAISQEITTALARSLKTLFDFYEIRSWFQEGESLFAQAAAVLAKPDHPSKRRQSRLWAQLLSRQGRFCFRLGDYERARELLQESIPILEDTAAWEEVASTLNTLGNVAHYLRQQDKARHYYEESLALSRRIGNRRGIAQSLNSLGVALRARGRYDEARQALKEGLAIGRELNARWLIAFLLNNLGVVSRMQGAYQEAKTYYQESLAIKRAMADKRGIAISLNNLGNIAHALGELAEAQELHRESMALCREIGDRQGVARSLNNLGQVAHAMGNYAEARQLHQDSLKIKQEIGDKRGMLHSFNHLGSAAAELGQLQQARQFFHLALKMGLAMRAIPLALDVLAGIAQLWAQAGNGEQALELLAFTRRHPRSEKQTQEKAAERLAEVAAQLSPEVASAAQERGTNRDMEAIVAAVLGETGLP